MLILTSTKIKKKKAKNKKKCHRILQEQRATVVAPKKILLMMKMINGSNPLITMKKVTKMMNQSLMKPQKKKNGQTMTEW